MLSDELMVQCWCGRHYGWAPRRLILCGRTFSCGPHCTPDTQLSKEEGAASRTVRVEHNARDGRTIIYTVRRRERAG